MQTIVVDPVSDSRWESWIRAQPGSGIFHSTAWAKVLTKTYSHKPMYLRFCRGGETTGLVPLMEVRSAITGLRGVSVPFSDSCNPILTDRSASAQVLEGLSALARERKWSYFEIRGPIGEQPQGRLSVEFFGHILELDGGIEKVLTGFASSVRRALRKAERDGVQVTILRTRDAVLDFYRLHCRTRKQHGVPPQPLSFFLSIYDEIIERGAGFIAIAKDGSRPIAGAVFFSFGKKAVYKFGASVESGRENRANNLVMWEAIKNLAQAGCDELDFGRTSLSNEGLRRFKLGWGTREEAIGYHKFDTTAGAWVAGRDKASGFFNSIFARMPLSLNRLAGAMIYPHLD